MRRCLIFIILCFCCLPSFVDAASRINPERPWWFLLPDILEVKRLRCWAPEYLTVTNNFNNVFFSSNPSALKFMSVIVEINGKSTKGMDENEFYQILANNTSIELKYISKINGENKSFHDNLKKPLGRPDCYAWTSWSSFPMGYFYNDKQYKKDIILQSWGEILSDGDFDFFEVCTYDYVFDADEDFLSKQQMLKNVTKTLEEKGLRRNKNNPDVYIYLTTDKERIIDRVYNSKITSSTSANGVGQSIFYRNRIEENHRDNITTHTQNVGSISYQVRNDIYAQLTIIDAKRMNDKVVPKIWQTTYQGFFSGDKIESGVNGILGVDIEAYPFDRPVTLKFKHEICFEGGYRIDDPSSTVMKWSGVLPETRIDMLGVKIGDVIEMKFSKSKYDKAWSCNECLFHYFPSYEGYLKINGKKITNIPTAKKHSVGGFLFIPYCFEDDL